MMLPSLMKQVTNSDKLLFSPVIKRAQCLNEWKLIGLKLPPSLTVYLRQIILKKGHGAKPRAYRKFKSLTYGRCRNVSSIKSPVSDRYRSLVVKQCTIAPVIIHGTFEYLPEKQVSGGSCVT